MTFFDDYLELLRLLARGELDPLPAWLGYEEAVRRSARALLDAGFPPALNAAAAEARPLVEVRGTMTLDEDPGDRPRARDGEAHATRSRTMSWQKELIDGLIDVSERLERVENTLRAAGYLDREGRPAGRAENRRSGGGRGGVDFEPTPILSGPRGEAVCDGQDARAEHRSREKAARRRRSRDGVDVEVTPIMSGPRGEAALDED